MGGGGVAVRLGEEEVLPGVVGDQLNKEALAKSSSWTWMWFLLDSLLLDPRSLQSSVLQCL